MFGPKLMEIALLASFAHGQAYKDPFVDYLIFTQSWPAPKGLNWTVQGLWPKQYGEVLSAGPKNCNWTDSFNSTEVRMLANLQMIPLFSADYKRL